jgi:hypothetical protein
MDLWDTDQGNLMNKCLLDYVDAHPKEFGHSVNSVIDLLSEFFYQSVFDWDTLHKELHDRGIKVLHRVPLGVSEPKFLPDLGRFYRYEIIDLSGRFFITNLLKPIKRDYFRHIAELRFEPEVVIDKNTENNLIRILTEQRWNRLNDETKKELVLAENLYDLSIPRLTKSINQKADRNMHYFAAVESELYNKIGANYYNKNIVLNNIGNYLYNLFFKYKRIFKKKIIGFRKFSSDFEYILKIRNATGHFRSEENCVTWEEMEKARNLILGRQEENGILGMIVDNSEIWNSIILD